MQPDRPSSTAEMVCAWRALESLLPPGRRIVDDPYARAFLGPGRGALIDVAEKLPPRALEALFRRIDRVLQGVMTFVLARHRAMDDLLKEQEGLEQVVLLGAGYDSRSVRLEEALRGATLFEVDHPATAGRKQELAPAVFGNAPRANTVGVTVDFARESIEDRLLEAGFHPGKRTLWFWEGVSMYLEEDAIRGTLEMVRKLSAPGALLTFDTWCPPSEGLQKIAKRELPILAMRLIYSEPFVWTPRPEALDGFVRESGLALIESVPGLELVQRYTRKRASLLTQLLSAGNMRLCVAEVERPD